MMDIDLLFEPLDKGFALLICERLNEFVNLDRQAIESLVDCRVFCNSMLADHPFLQVGSISPEQPLDYMVGLLGIVNGLLRTNNFIIQAVYEHDALINFVVVDKEGNAVYD